MEPISFREPAALPTAYGRKSPGTGLQGHGRSLPAKPAGRRTIQDANPQDDPICQPARPWAIPTANPVARTRRIIGKGPQHGTGPSGSVCMDMSGGCRTTAGYLRPRNPMTRLGKRSATAHPDHGPTPPVGGWAFAPDRSVPRPWSPQDGDGRRGSRMEAAACEHGDAGGDLGVCPGS